MDGFRSESPKPWSNTTNAGVLESTDQEAPWKNFGSSLNALSFGLVATAILISMFLIMAIFEHLLRPRTAFGRNAVNRSLGSVPRTQIHLLDKLGHSFTVPAACPVDFSVLMPGQQTPTFIAQPAPFPCPREEREREILCKQSKFSFLQASESEDIVRSLKEKEAPSQA